MSINQIFMKMSLSSSSSNTKFQRTIDAGWREIRSLRQCGWKIETIYKEPNKVFVYQLINRKEYRRLFVEVQPLWGLVVIRNGRCNVKLIDVK